MSSATLLCQTATHVILEETFANITEQWWQNTKYPSETQVKRNVHLKHSAEVNWVFEKALG